MDKQTAIDHFGSVKALALALGITPAAVYQWGDTVPLLRELQIERIVRERQTTPERAA